ncbi:4-carboxy-4-hydroxy-2-oxoadipate aldolase/oxaloacetate decarboxylase [Paenibacillus xerothermodurans]|uniref:Putative 4-hydroxy-4-methyl-2-oxoglutarate aldolase n=1 Tax=Paenibacillus xerothermodurans TaxID=1977292 RepID=A0A2W1N9A6_PAEXE|nr:4-carboxy-4-hydroxy-2-oxoadipate aldolase/oxaloacetate decarboxylase [Paenibacillus xerothermodurans]PZE21219.1 4-carboxy-4-hydroxy-2-oxoadipate aldolase/oxaloacetate decarboxylase [Paenibacillus xerothermodurans]
MQKYIVTNIRRPEQETVARFKEHDTSTVYEAQGKIGLLSAQLKPISANSKICGPAVTVICPAGDNLMIHAAIEVCKPGDVLVITTLGESISGMIGELIVLALMKKGVQGVVIDAGVRDVARLRGMGFPVWSKAVYPEGTTKSRGGWVNAPAICGGVQVMPGDLIVADDDGVVVVAQEDISTTLESAVQRVRKEKQTKEKIGRGEISLDFYGLRSVLQQENIVYFDEIPLSEGSSRGL